MLKTVLFCFVVLHAVIGQVRKPHPKIGKVTCIDLKPQGDTHNRGVEDTSDFFEQYEIKQNNSKLYSWDILRITISGKNSNTLKGFIVQVRPENSTTAVGVFIVHPEDPLIQTINCGQQEKNTALLKFPDPPQEYKAFPEVTMTWSPHGYKGKVNVVATVIKVGQVFWVARKSNVMIVK